MELNEKENKKKQTSWRKAKIDAPSKKKEKTREVSRFVLAQVIVAQQF